MRLFVTMLALVISVAASVGAAAETLLERGTYLMQGVVACGSCYHRAGRAVQGQGALRRTHMG